MPDATALVIIARAPEAGRIKTRLAAGIGAERTLAVYRQLLAVVVAAQASWPGPVLLATSGADAAWEGSGLEHLPRRPQPSGGLGGRVAAALRWGHEHCPRVVAIGTDCPGLRGPHLDALVALLTDVPVAFGPAADGGYWGVALADPRAIPLVGDDALPWSTPRILAESRARLVAAGLACALGETLADCDDADDLAAAVAAGFLRWPTSMETSR